MTPMTYYTYIYIYVYLFEPLLKLRGVVLFGRPCWFHTSCLLPSSADEIYMLTANWPMLRLWWAHVGPMLGHLKVC